LEKRSDRKGRAGKENGDEVGAAEKLRRGAGGVDGEDAGRDVGGSQREA
jgi:hypothetical protein